MSDIRDMMIDGDMSYEDARESMADAADMRRKEMKENPRPNVSKDRMAGLGWQPDDVFMVGDRVIWTSDDDDLGDLVGTVTRADVGSDMVMVKLDTGGTFDCERADLRKP